MIFSRFAGSILIVIGLLLFGCNTAKQEAIDHFRHNQSRIEIVVRFMEANPGIDYVEFNADGSVDLSLLNKEEFKPRTGYAVFKYDLFNASLQSADVGDALRYAGISMQQFMTLKKLLNDAGCISVQKDSFEEKSYEVGYMRDSMSKWIYERRKGPVNFEGSKKHIPLAADWSLTLSPPAFN